MESENIMKTITYALVFLMAAPGAWAGAKKKTDKNIHLTCREYRSATACYPASWYPLDENFGRGRKMVNEQFFSNPDLDINHTVNGRIARNWAEISVGDMYNIYNNIPASAPTGDLWRYALSFQPCTGRDTADCIRPLQGRTVNGTAMSFYEIVRVEPANLGMKSVNVFFKAGGRPYWVTFSSHSLDFDRYWPYFYTVLSSFKAR